MGELDNFNFKDRDIEDLLSSIDGLLDNIEQYHEQEKTITGEARYKVNLDEYREKGYREPQLQEIAAGMKANLPVALYAKDCYNWQQMREIRLGLMEELNVRQYMNPMYSYGQMHQIRMGMKNRLPVEQFAKLVYSASDMKARREKLFQEAYRNCPSGYAYTDVDVETELEIRISDDCMSAYVLVEEKLPKNFPLSELKRILQQQDIVSGFDEINLAKIAAGHATDKELLVARGKEPEQGKDGYYELHFQSAFAGELKKLDDGTMDYAGIPSTDKVFPGQLLAVYKEATEGIAGNTVTNILLPAASGKSQKPLTGSTVAQGKDHNSYYAVKEGYVSYNEEDQTIDIYPVCVIRGDVSQDSGVIDIAGAVHIIGSAVDHAVIHATGDIIIDGYATNAEICSGGNVLIKGGMRGGNQGVIEAEGKVMGNFFEAVEIKAKRTVESNLFLNCLIETEECVFAKGDKGRILGGCIVAAIGVEAESIGNQGKTQTEIHIGDLRWIEGRIYELYQCQEKLSNQIQQKAGSDQLKIDLSENQELMDLQADMEHLQKVRQKAMDAYIKVTGKLQSNVLLTLNREKKEYRDNISGVMFTAGGHR